MKVFQVVRLYRFEDIMDMSGDVGCWFWLLGSLVGLLVFRKLELELLMISSIMEPR